MTFQSVDVVIEKGIPQSLLLDAAQLYYDGQLKRFPGVVPRGTTIEELVDKLDPHYAFSAVEGDGVLLGLAAFATWRHGFWQPDPTNPWKTNSAGVAIKKLFSGRSLVAPRTRPREDGVLLLEGVFVTAKGLKRGVGEPLMESVIAEAKKLSMSRVQVFVEEPNPTVKAVYERHGFRNKTPLKQYSVSYYIDWRFTEMILDLD
ncbi:MAG: GNAT family N-acetyltransferase [Pseudomonadota bacterium]